MKKKTKVSFDKISFEKLRRLYLFALITIAITVILSQFLIQYNLYSQLSDSKIINTSGKQRMLSQKLTKEVLVLNITSDSLEKKEQINKIYKTISDWKSNHSLLINGSDSLGYPKQKNLILTVSLA
jgi:two-component system, NarL family, sensor histidine kinase DegS